MSQVASASARVVPRIIPPGLDRLGRPLPVFGIPMTSNLSQVLGTTNRVTYRMDFLGEILGWLLTFATNDATITVDNFELRRGANPGAGFQTPSSDPAGETVEVFMNGFTNVTASVDQSNTYPLGRLQFFPGYFLLVSFRRSSGAAAATGVGAFVRLTQRQTSM